MVQLPAVRQHHANKSTPSALAIILATMSLLVHFGVFAVLRTALGESWTTSWCAVYDLCAVFASLGGVIGAVDVSTTPSTCTPSLPPSTRCGAAAAGENRPALRNPDVLTCGQRRPFLFAAYAAVHSVTLTLVTGVLVINAVPLSVVGAGPGVMLRWRYTEGLERSMCREDGFGWDDSWLDQCRSGFAVLSTGAMWVAFAMVAAQWWAMCEVWGWVASKRSRREGRARAGSTGKVRFVDEVQGLESIKEV